MSTDGAYACCLVGGTFDRFHSGHKLLLNMAITRSKRVEIHIISDDIASRKSPFIQDFHTRYNAILDWLEKKSYQTVKLFQLNDSFGPAPVHKSADAIVATPETRSNCEEINRMRVSNELPELTVLEVPHMLDYSGKIISSSRIRRGKIDSDGNPWLDEKLRTAKLKMVTSLDSELKNPMGELFEGPEDMPDVAMTEALQSINRDNSSLVAVGDVSVATLLEMGVMPDIALIDGMTKRQELQESEKIDAQQFPHILHAENPPGHLTPSLTKAIDAALNADESSLINVDGEEDLAPIIIHCLAPIGTAVIYGQPKVGVVVQISTLEVKSRCRNLLSMFEVLG